MSSVKQSIGHLVVRHSMDDGFISLDSSCEAYFSDLDKIIDSIHFKRKLKDLIDHNLKDVNQLIVSSLDSCSRIDLNKRMPFRFSEFKGRTIKWFDPELFIVIAKGLGCDVSAWDFVKDFVLERKKASELHKMLHADIDKIEGCGIMAIVNIINTKVFGAHYRGIRENSTYEDIKELNSIQQKLVTGIKTGLVKDIVDVTKIINEHGNKKNE